MPVAVVVGGQTGSEAKAKAAVHLARNFIKDRGLGVVSIRCGGPNAGHTVFLNGNKRVLRLIPSGVAIPGAALVIAPGAMVDVGLLVSEIDAIEGMGVPVRHRLIVDRATAIVDPDSLDQERLEGLGDRIGSTQTGTGATASRRCLRRTLEARQDETLIPYVRDTVEYVHMMMKAGWLVIVEGTQGFGLSLYHSGYHRYCTSKDTSAAAFISEAGISPRDVDDIVMVIRTYPIRVGGNSGPMNNEIDWETVRSRSGRPDPLVEMTSVTKKVRRVSEFDWDAFDRAVMVNKPTQIAIHGLDYLDYGDTGKTSLSSLSTKSIDFIRKVQRRSQVPVTMAFTGPHQDDAVDLPDGIHDSAIHYGVNWKLAVPVADESGVVR